MFCLLESEGGAAGISRTEEQTFGAMLLYGCSGFDEHGDPVFDGDDESEGSSVESVVSDSEDGGPSTGVIRDDEGNNASDGDIGSEEKRLLSGGNQHSSCQPH